MPSEPAPTTGAARSARVAAKSISLTFFQNTLALRTTIENNCNVKDSILQVVQHYNISDVEILIREQYEPLARASGQLVFGTRVEYSTRQDNTLLHSSTMRTRASSNERAELFSLQISTQSSTQHRNTHTYLSIISRQQRLGGTFANDNQNSCDQLSWQTISYLDFIHCHTPDQNITARAGRCRSFVTKSFETRFMCNIQGDNIPVLHEITTATISATICDILKQLAVATVTQRHADSF